MARQRTSEKTLLVLCIVGFFLAVATLSTISMLQHKKVNALRRETKNLNVQAAKLQKKIVGMDEKREQRDTLAEEIKEYEKMLPDAKEIEKLMSTVADQAKASNCIISSFSIADESVRGRRAKASGGDYKMVKFDCSVVSASPGKGYYTACKFLNLMEGYKRFMAADVFSIRAATDLGMTMDLKAHTYRFAGAQKPKETPAGGSRGTRGTR